MSIPSPPDRKVILANCRPRYGTTNPEHSDNPYWTWAIRAEFDPYTARQSFKIPASGATHRKHGARHTYRDDPAGPVWTYQRFGMSELTLDDGRTLTIGGEHEDWYDPDFCIYNDVVVRTLDGTIDIYIYPMEVFPPTDFHTATRVGNRVYIIGSVGYTDQRTPATTPVYALDVETMAIEPLDTRGDVPGWVGHHTARHDFRAGTIVISGGAVCVAHNAGSQRFEPLEDTYSLNLDTMEWTRVD